MRGALEFAVVSMCAALFPSEIISVSKNSSIEMEQFRGVRSS